jgi:predicted DNA-binding protein (MmcQ/YjbR family)
MSRRTVNVICKSLPGAEVSDPWGGGHDGWKVGGKLFAIIGAAADHGIGLKCPDVETAALLIDLGRAERAPYLHASWIRLPWGRLSDAELAERIETSYSIVRAGLPKRVRDALGPA